MRKTTILKEAKKYLILFLAVIMIVSSSTIAFAAEADPVQTEEQETAAPVMDDAEEPDIVGELETTVVEEPDVTSVFFDEPENNTEPAVDAETVTQPEIMEEIPEQSTESQAVTEPVSGPEEATAPLEGQTEIINSGEEPEAPAVLSQENGSVKEEPAILVPEENITGSDNKPEANKPETAVGQAGSEEPVKAQKTTAEKAKKEQTAEKAAQSNASDNKSKDASLKKESNTVNENASLSKENSSEKTSGTKAAEKEKKTQRSAVRLYAAQIDNSTKLPDGEYTVPESDFKFEGGTGKARLTLDKIVVQNGKAIGYFTASSTNFTHVYYLGHTLDETEDPSIYDPATGICADGVKPFSSQKVNFPVRLNQEQEIACRSVKMSEPHWIQYAYKITIDETEKEILTDLSVNNTIEDLIISKAVLGTMEFSGKQNLKISAGNKTFTKMYLGTAAKAEKNANAAITLSGDQMFTFSADDVLNKTIDAAFYSTKDKVWHEGTINFDNTKKTLTLKEGKKADYSKVKAAKNKVPADLSIYKENRVKVLKDALAAVKEGLYASQQSQVDAFAQKIEKAIAALEKEKLTITFRALDEKTGKVISGAAIEVKDSKGQTVKADKAGVYSLKEDTYSVKATAKNYEDATLENFNPTVEETIDLKLTAKEIIPPGTTIFKEDEKDPSKTNLFNTTAMFKVIKGVLVKKNDKATLTVTLNGQGYHYLFKGTYEEAIKNGLKKKNWIKGTQNAEGKWEFEIPLEESETFIALVAISDSHLKKVEEGDKELGYAFYPRQIELDIKKNTLTAGDYDAEVDITVNSKTDKFNVDPKGKMEVIGGPNSNNYACKPVIKMKDDLFSKAFIGTAADAAKSGAAVIDKKSGSFTFSFENSFGENGKEKMFEDNKPIAVAFYDTEQGKWVDYKLTIDKANSTVTIEALKEDEAPPEKPEQNETEPDETTPDNKDNKNEEKQNYQDDSNKGTAQVDNQTTLKDGIYTPKNFRYSGGTGRIVITCQSVEVRNGQAYATITFGRTNGGEASIDSVRANGQVYSGFNTFTIPVQLNANNTVVARTTAMSQAHWIEYTIYIELDEPEKDADGANKDGDKETKDVSEKIKELDEKAPDIIGLSAEGEMEVVYSDLVKIFTYEDGYYLIEVDAVKDTARDTLEYQTALEIKSLQDEADNKDASGNAENEAASLEEPMEEGESAAQESISEKIAKLYENEIIKYLVVPEGKDIPAGLDKEVIIIKQPADKTFIYSPEAMRLVSALGAEANITASGIDASMINDEALKEVLEGLPDAGTFDKWDLRRMISDKSNLALESSEILPRDEKTLEDDMANMIRLGERAAQMDLAMFIDRSEDEENDLAKAEWLRVYGIIFHAQDRGEALYKETIDAASQDEKDAAKQLLEKRSEEKTKLRKEAHDAAEKQIKED